MNRYEFGVRIAGMTGFKEETLAEIKPVMQLILEKAEDKLAEIEDHLARRTTTPAEVRALAEYVGVDVDLGMLAITLLLTSRSQRIYKENGIPDGIFTDTMKNIRISANEYAHDYNGRIGMTRYAFVSRNLWGEVLRHGRLEYEIETFSGELYESHGVTLKKGDPILKIHIPSDEPMGIEAVEESFRRAYHYYRLAPLTSFMCSSWLTYPGNRNFCKPDSNIIKFMECFDILTSEDCPKCGDLHRIFGKQADLDHPETFSEETSLQRSLKAHLLKGGTMGKGYGIFLHDGEKRLTRGDSK